MKEPSRYQRNLSARRDSFQKRRAHIDYAHAASSFSPQAIAQQAEYAAAWPGVKEGSWKWKGHNIRFALAILRRSMDQLSVAEQLGVILASNEPHNMPACPVC